MLFLKDGVHPGMDSVTGKLSAVRERHVAVVWALLLEKTGDPSQDLLSCWPLFGQSTSRARGTKEDTKPGQQHEQRETSMLSDKAAHPPVEPQLDGQFDSFGAG